MAGKASLDAGVGGVCKHLGGRFQAEAPSPALGLRLGGQGHRGRLPGRAL